jgi:hypothetical protein
MVRNTFSKATIEACCRSVVSSRASACCLAAPSEPATVSSRAVACCNHPIAAGLAGERCGSSASRLCSVKRVSSVAVSAMPRLPPSWRDRLNRPVPWASCAGRRSATAAPVSGTKMKPRPTPRRIIGQTRSCIPMAVVRWESSPIDQRKSSTPMVMSTRASTRGPSRPMAAMVKALAMAPGRITRPVSHAE